MNKKVDILLQLCQVIKIVIIGLCFLNFIYVTVKWAWCSDDAYHAYIMSKNLINGYEFTPTIGKRVNVSTCPLWTIITTVGMLICPDEYYTGMILNLAFSWGAFYVLIKQLFIKCDVQNEDVVRNVIYTIIKLIVLVQITELLCKSKAFISYTTSGLENPLLFFLATVFLVYYFRIYKNNKYFGYKEIFYLAFIEGLIIFARIDAGLIFLPLCLHAGLNIVCDSKNTRIICYCKRILVAILGLFPFIIWETFSFFYYGVLVPNTALAKLNTGFPQYQYNERGIAYYIVTLEWDFIVVAMPVFFVLISILMLTLSKFNSEYVPFVLIGIGILSYMGYIVHIGGDFMKGRHFTVIYWTALFSVIYVIEELLRTRKVIFSCIMWGVLCISIVTSLKVSNGTIENPAKEYAKMVRWNYTDERDNYIQYTGLINLIKSGKDLIWTCQHRGIQWYSGVNFYEERLYDPLLSRLPAIDDNDKWVVGHMYREFPPGYQETLDTGINHIENDSLHEYYDVLLEIISGELYSKERVRTIIQFNLGKYDYLIDEYLTTTL